MAMAKELNVPTCDLSYEDAKSTVDDSTTLNPLNDEHKSNKKARAGSLAQTIESANVTTDQSQELLLNSKLED